MITNKKVIEEIIEQTKISNNDLREQLKSQILNGSNETSKNIISVLTQKYENGIAEICQNYNQRSEVLKQEISELSEKNHDEHYKIIAEYDTALKSLRDDMNSRIDALSEEVIGIGKALSDSIVNLQKDNAIIMESIHLILTNLLINGVKDQ